MGFPLVLPSVEPASATCWWLVPALLVGMGLLLAGDAPDALRATPDEAMNEDWGHAAA